MKKSAGGASSDGSARSAERNLQMNYNTKTRTKTRARTILIMVLAALTIVHGVMVLEKADAGRDRWEPDCEFPMANANISWEQTFYPGGVSK